MRSRSLARVVIASLGVSVVITLGCGKPPTAPSPPTATATVTVTVEFGGRVVNADTGGPVENVLVSVFAFSTRGGGLGLAAPDPKETATSGGDGTFSLSLNVPSDWKMVSLKFTGPAGFEDTSGRFEPTAAPCALAPCWAAADRPAIRMYPTLVIRPGDSIEVRVDVNMPWCGWAGDGGPCRRVLVAASPGDSVELEVVPDDSRKPMALSLEAPFLEPDMSVRSLMVPPGGFPYVLGDGTGRLTARR